MQLTGRRCALALIMVAALSAFPRGAAAQTSPAADLLARAHGALDNLKYAEADSLATMVLRGFGDRLTPAQRVEALQIAAAALYPDPAGGGVQRRDTALALLRQVVRIAPEGLLRQDLAWAGLDTLFAIAKRTTLAALVRVEERTVLTGPHAALSFDVIATVPARFAATLTSAAGGPAVASDTAGLATRAALTLRAPLLADQSLAGGAYILRIVARDSAATDSVVFVYDATVDAPPLGLTPLPLALDSTRLKPEMEAPARSRGLVAGLVVGGGTMLAVALKGPGLLSGSATDGRGIAIGLGLAAGAVIGGLLDHGHPSPENIAANETLRRQFEASLQSTRAENQRRRDAYSVTVTLRERR